MKIIRFYAENFKRLKCVEVTPDGDIVLLKGQNTNGKTSVLDAIWAALQWRSASKEISSPINSESDSGLIEIDIGDYIVKRTFTEGDEGKVTTKLTITKPNGDPVRKPQAILDGLIGKVSFDPMEFARMDGSKQRQTIADLVGLDLASYEAERKEAYTERTAVRREIKRLETYLQSLAPPTDNEPTGEVSVADLVKEMQAVEKQTKDRARIVSRMSEIDRLIFELQSERDSLAEDLQNAPEPDPDRTVYQIQQEIGSIESRNARAREIEKYNTTVAALADRRQEETTLCARIELADINKDEAVEAAHLPIDGLTIEPDGVTVDGVAWKELSQAEKIRHSMAIAMASNPKLRVIRVTDGSLLDRASMDLISQMASDQDFQVWVEIVADEPDGIGVYLENGQVRDG